MSTDRLNVTDTAFLEMDDGGPAQTVGARIVIAGEAPTIEELRDFVESRRDRTPRLYQRVQRSGLSVIKRGKWVDCDVDPTYHIREEEIGDDPRGFDGAVGRLLSAPMDLDRPLWSMHLFKDIGHEGRFGLVWISHHSMADGQGTNILVGHFQDLSPDGPPTLTDAMLKAAHDRLDAPDPADDEAEAMFAEKAVAELARSWEAVKDAAARMPATVETFGELLPKKKSELTGRISEGRSNVAVTGSLADAKKAGRAVGATVNDVVMAAVAAGFTDLLRSKGSNVAGRSIRCLMPVTMRDPRNDKINNQVAIVPVVLPLGIDDPAERLKLIHQSTVAAKGSLLPMLTDQVAGIASRWLPNALQETISDIASGPGVHLSRLVADTVVTNVPGAQFPIYFMGRRIVSAHALMPLSDPVRFLIAILSYDGDINISVTSDDAHWDDAYLLAGGIRDALSDIAQVLAST